MSVQLVGRNFDRGYQSDRPRDQLGRGVAFRLRDWIPDLDAPLRKRGGWSFSSQDLSQQAPATSLYSLGWTYFAGDPHLILVADNGNVYFDKFNNGVSGVYVGATPLAGMTHQPVWNNDGNLAVLVNGLGQAARSPYKYYAPTPGNYAVAALGGTPPQASVAESWEDYLLLANGYVGGTQYRNRIWISAVGAPETWNTGTAFEDMPAEVVRLVKMWNTILVWGYNDVWSISGDTPPPGGNWSQKTVFVGNGTMDGRTVVPFQSWAIWANTTGVYKSDGFTLTDLTERGGIKQRWQELVSGFNFTTGWSAAAGIYRNTYVITVYNAAGQFVTCQCFDIENESWYEFTNVPALMFAQRFSGPGTANEDGAEELFFAHRALPRGGKMSTCWTPSLAVANDGDGSPVLPQIEMPFYKLGGSGRKIYRRAYITYDLRSAGGTPYLSADYILSPEEAAAYVALGVQLPATTQEARKRFTVGKRGIGLGLRLTQVGASADTRLADIELDFDVLEQMR